MGCFADRLIVALAASTPTVVAPSDWASVMDALTAQISVSNVVAVMASIAGATIGFGFLYWGVRKAIRALMGAFKKGRVSAG